MPLPPLTDSHPKWRDFIKRLMDFGMSDCDSTQALTTQVLCEFEGISIIKTLRWLESKGGWCACEVIFNVVSDDLLSELSDEKRDERESFSA